MKFVLVRRPQDGNTAQHPKGGYQHPRPEEMALPVHANASQPAIIFDYMTPTAWLRQTSRADLPLQLEPVINLDSGQKR
jgi:hypothetical protein